MTREAITFKTGGLLSILAGWEVFDPFKQGTFGFFLISSGIILVVALVGGATTEMVREYLIGFFSRKKRSHANEQHSKTYT